MKKVLLSLAMFITLGTMSAFADSADVSPKVLSAFNNDFNSEPVNRLKKIEELRIGKICMTDVIRNVHE